MKGERPSTETGQAAKSDVWRQNVTLQNLSYLYLPPVSSTTMHTGSMHVLRTSCYRHMSTTGLLQRTVWTVRYHPFHAFPSLLYWSIAAHCIRTQWYSKTVRYHPLCLSHSVLTAHERLYLGVQYVFNYKYNVLPRQVRVQLYYSTTVDLLLTVLQHSTTIFTGVPVLHLQ